ncbi:thioesterase II family protein [Pseudoduganella namucuonensis]|uniref:Medium-chain acyl-[acyl-carrier-protein] hydrolase n=1 Tax=Pseudoduganella namucuonensis TaxID=1035707 RepID=A0A1I7LXL2_9BURK|nr:alpha/beta fold hydrolase [Pseudoduganella namucuonensis]SFV14432.1 medium-chain acyl-[acyl-carrier-protein] hydrolase [Pseudoduganella namucuonensis]
MQHTPWLTRLCSGAPRMRLYCFPYAGGGAEIYAGWHAALPGVEICAVQLPGRGSRFGETPIDTLSELLAELAQLTSRDRSLPFAFFGHSLGALLAFELARYCRRHYLPLPQCLIVSGCDAPNQRKSGGALHTLPDDELIAALGRYNGTPPQVLANAELMALLLPAIRADFALGERYAYRLQPPLALPLSVYAGKDDTLLSPETVKGWSVETSETCRTQWFNGDHFFLHAQRDAVLEALRGDLAAR